MIVFSQYNIQIYCSTLSCLISIFLAIISSPVTINTKRKILLTFLPLVINFIQYAYIIIDIYFNGLDNKLVKWSKQGLESYVEETDIISFTNHIFLISVCAMVVTFIFVYTVKKSSFNDKQLTNYYLKLTDSQRESGHMMIIGGSMDFLGKPPCNKMLQDTTCPNTYKHSLERYTSKQRSKECDNCCLNNKQWKQLHKLVNMGCRINIVCTHPSNTENEVYSKAMIGFIIKSWDTNKNISISFFNVNNNPNIKGRVIEDYNKTKHVCWNFKTTNNEKNTYEMPNIYSENSRLGAFIIEAFDNIQSSGKKISQDERIEFISQFEKIKGNNDNVKQKRN